MKTFSLELCFEWPHVKTWCSAEDKIGTGELWRVHWSQRHSRSGCCNVVVVQCWNLCYYFFWWALRSLSHPQSLCRRGRCLLGSSSSILETISEKHHENLLDQFRQIPLKRGGTILKFFSQVHASRKNSEPELWSSIDCHCTVFPFFVGNLDVPQNGVLVTGAGKTATFHHMATYPQRAAESDKTTFVTFPSRVCWFKCAHFDNISVTQHNLDF